jgi:hypothetical protein
MKTCVSIKSFCNTNEKQKVLMNFIAFLRQNYDYPIILHAAYNVPVEISDSVDYYLYYNNSVYADKVNSWRIFQEGVFRAYTQDYGFAELKQVLDVANFAENQGFSIVHTFNYDIDTSHFSQEFLRENEEHLKAGKEVCFHTFLKNYAGLLFYSYRTEAMKRIQVKDAQDWKKYVIDEPYVCENGFYRVFTQLDYKITRENFHFKDLIHTSFIDFADLPDRVESAGIYKRTDNGYTLLITFTEKIAAVLSIDTEEVDVEDRVCIHLSEYPSEVLLNKTEIFPKWKMIAMKENLIHEVYEKV